ncbi:MAG: GAF domain-containing protein [Candidatus Limnocylindrales bacterium]
MAATELHEAGDTLRELGFHEIAQTRTLARDWDELMRTIAERTTAATSAEVCLPISPSGDAPHAGSDERAGSRTRPARSAGLWGEGVTGRVAQSCGPIAIDDGTTAIGSAGCVASISRRRPRCCSVLLVLHGSVVGVPNVSGPCGAPFQQGRGSALLQTIAALLAGHRREGPADRRDRVRPGLAQLTSPDAARAELPSVVTHDPRTPLVRGPGVRGRLAGSTRPRGRTPRPAGGHRGLARGRRRPARPARPAGRF